MKKQKEEFTEFEKMIISVSENKYNYNQEIQYLLKELFKKNNSHYEQIRKDWLVQMKNELEKGLIFLIGWYNIELSRGLFSETLVDKKTNFEFVICKSGFTISETGFEIYKYGNLESPKLEIFKINMENLMEYVSGVGVKRTTDVLFNKMY
ncbi:hypothetical protein [Psychroserpens mesophilus]|uniref:hypothetical protein n=1 Tax=Psychroserpens mesophilus TaxID=325473 RepID=UPI003D649B2C